MINFTIGVVVGVFICVVVWLVSRLTKTTLGTLIIDKSDTHKDLYHIVLNDDLEGIDKKKRVDLKVLLNKSSQN